jgi:hypothetical protein
MRQGILGPGLVSMLLGCAAAPSVAPGSVAETQLHAACPDTGRCEEPLICVGGEDTREPRTCELACHADCPASFQCMPRPDGEKGGVCMPSTRPPPFGT